MGRGSAHVLALMTQRVISELCGSYCPFFHFTAFDPMWSDVMASTI